MKRMITTILLLLLFVPLFSQDRTLEKVDENVYRYRVTNSEGSVTQKGTYIKNEEGNLLMHGYWSNDLGTKALYKRGILVWIKPKGHPRYTYKEIELEQLKAEVRRLKDLIALNGQSSVSYTHLTLPTNREV